jgi:hypothetical protein
MAKLLMMLVAVAAFSCALAGEPVREDAGRTSEPRKLQEGDFVAILGGVATEAKVYSVYLEAYLIACRPAPGLRAMQFGYGYADGILTARCSPTGPHPFKPTVATMFYAKQAGSRDNTGQDGYGACAKAMIQRCKGAGARFVAVATGSEEAEIVAMGRKAAVEEGGAFVDLPTPMAEALGKAREKYGKDYNPSFRQGAWGLVAAYGFLKALGCDGNIGTVTLDLSNGKAAATDGHKLLASKGGVVELESSRYPFCFYGDPKSPDATTGIIEFLPFNQDLNRFMLVVKGAKSAKLKVTWGKTSKEFDAAALDKGVNLAAEFPDNPFSEPFKKVLGKVLEKQTFEDALFSEIRGVEAAKTYLTANLSAEAAGHMQAIADFRVGEERKRQDEVAASVVPVKHSITVEPAG